MARPTKIVPPETIKRWKLRAVRDKNADWEASGVWAERRLLDVINSHEALRGPSEHQYLAMERALVGLLRFLDHDVRIATVHGDRWRNVFRDALKSLDRQA